jgi:outer membrane protein assembly factor BamB
VRAYAYSGSEDACPGRVNQLYSDNSILGFPPATLFSTDANDRPIALDLDTGAVRWTGSRQAVPIDADDGVVLVRDALGLGLANRDHWRTGRLAALDASNGKPLWVGPAPAGDRDDPRTAVYGDVVLDAMINTRVTVRDRKTGTERWQSADGDLVGAGPGWFAVTYVDRLRYYAIAP